MVDAPWPTLPHFRMSSLMSENEGSLFCAADFQGPVYLEAHVFHLVGAFATPPARPPFPAFVFEFFGGGRDASAGRAEEPTRFSPGAGWLRR